MMDLNQIWQSTLSELELQISRPNFLTWFRNSRLMKKDENGQAIVGLANNFAREWVQSKYHKLIIETIHSFDESVKKIDYVILSKDEQNIKTILEPETSSQISFPEFKIDPESN